MQGRGSLGLVGYLAIERILGGAQLSGRSATLFILPLPKNLSGCSFGRLKNRPLPRVPWRGRQN